MGVYDNLSLSEEKMCQPWITKGGAYRLVKGRNFCVNRKSKKVHLTSCSYVPKNENRININGAHADFESAMEAAKNLLEVEHVERCFRCG